MAYHIELELSSINAHGVDQQRRCIGPLPEHLVCMVLSHNGGKGTSSICSECVKINEMFSEKYV